MSPQFVRPAAAAPAAKVAPVAPKPAPKLGLGGAPPVRPATATSRPIGITVAAKPTPAPAVAATTTADLSKQVVEGLKRNDEALKAISNQITELGKLIQISKAPTAQATTAAPLVRPPGAQPKPPVAASGTSPAPAKVQPSPTPSTPPPAGTDAFETMNRKQLTEAATAAGIAVPAGCKADDIRALLRAGGAVAAEEAQEGAPAGIEGVPASYTEGTVQRAEILIGLIDANAEWAAPFIDPEAPEGTEGAMRCGGNCLQCPDPEEYPTPADQVTACFNAFHEALSLEVPETAP